MKRNIKFRRKKRFPRPAAAAVCAVVFAVLAVGCFLAVKNLSDAGKRPGGGKNTAVFDPKGFENVCDIKCLNEAAAVFTDYKSGAKGLMTLDGRITEKAEYKEFFVYFDASGSPVYAVESPRSEYLTLVDPQTFTVLKKQFHGPFSPKRTPLWNEDIKRAAWYDEKGFAGAIKEDEFLPARGPRPIRTARKEGAKFGYIDESLRLVVPAVYDEARDFSEGLAAVKKDGEWGYVNTDGIAVIPFSFDSCKAADASGKDIAFAFRRGLAPACKNGKFGIINSRGETTEPFVYDRIIQGADGIYLALKDGKWGKLKVSEKYLAAPVTAAKTDPSAAPTGALCGTRLVKTRGSPLNLRAKPDITAPVLAKIPNGSELTVEKSAGGWAYCRYKGFSGWVSSDFLLELKTAGGSRASEPESGRTPSVVCS